MQAYTLAQVSEHKSGSDMWLTIDSKVYNISSFLSDHPGGEEVLLEFAGLDASEAFEEIGHSQDARDLLVKMQIGTLAGAAAGIVTGEPVRKQKVKAPSYSVFYAMMPILVAALVYYHFSTA